LRAVASPDDDEILEQSPENSPPIELADSAHWETAVDTMIGVVHGRVDEPATCHDVAVPQVTVHQARGGVVVQQSGQAAVVDRHGESVFVQADSGPIKIEGHGHVVAATVGVLGLGASPLLMIPAATGILAVLLVSRIEGEPAHTAGMAAAKRHGRDDWRSFVLMSAAIVCRSIVFVALGSFLVLFVHQYRGFGEFAAGSSLFVFYLGGACGTAIGGYLARRWARTTILRWSYAVSVPVLVGLLLVPGPAVFPFIALASITLYVPFSLHVSLGQDYLPRHMGTASGVTLGLAVSVGGLASPAIGALADRVGLEHALLPLIALPAVACLVLARLKDPETFTAPAATLAEDASSAPSTAALSPSAGTD
jgi:hypothetical protein